ncbi:MAG TPA: DUF1294 domain-containing protein [Planctomycetota bacterium]|nr:DUF1294 domain-containing protein [Planctomycetota bacterium]
MSGNASSSPSTVFAAVALGIITGATAVAAVWAAAPLIGYIVGISAATMTLYAYDKRAAVKNRMRVPERVLHGLALLGGSPAALVSQRIFRHKTSKASFRIWFWLIVLFQIAVIAVAVWWHWHPPAWLPEGLRAPGA